MSRAEGIVLTWRENRLALGSELRTILEAEADLMTPLEMDVGITH